MALRIKLEHALDILNILAVKEKELKDQFEGMPITMAQAEAYSLEFTRDMNNMIQHLFPYIRKDLATVHISFTQGVLITVEGFM